MTFSAVRREPLDGERERSESGVVHELAGVLEKHGEGFLDRAHQCRELARRLAEGRLQVAVLGQFKRGKSTFLNALIGESILPSAVVPLTAVPTFLQWGKVRSLAVRFADGRAVERLEGGVESLHGALARWVTEDGNPANRERVLSVELTHPGVPRGVVLIDTPGVGSTYRHNTDVTLAFLSECDAAVFLVSADPPITEVEVEFLNAVSEQVPRLFFVLNKIDYLQPDEQREAVDFLVEVLQRQIAQFERELVFEVSAKLALQARQCNSSEEWCRSGMARVEQRLLEFLVAEKRDALLGSVLVKALRVGKEALFDLRISRQAVDLSEQEVVARQAALERALTKIERSHVRARDVLDSDRRRLRLELDREAEELRVAAEERLLRAGSAVLEGSTEDHRRTVEEAVAEEIPSLFEAALETIGERVERRLEKTLEAHRLDASATLEQVRRSVAEAFSVPYEELDETRWLVGLDRPSWLTEQWPTDVEPLTGALLDSFLPRGARYRRILGRLERLVTDLVRRNVECLRWSIAQGIDQAFRRFATRFEEELSHALDSTRATVSAAVEARQEGSAAVAAQRLRLERAIAELESLTARIERAA